MRTAGLFGLVWAATLAATAVLAYGMPSAGAATSPAIAVPGVSAPTAGSASITADA